MQNGVDVIDFRGGFYWSDDVPNKTSPHFIVIASNTNKDGKVLVIPLSSVKTDDFGQEKFYDKSCIVFPPDILDDNGNTILSKKSFVRYQYATEMDAQKILQSAVSGSYKYHTTVKKELLIKIQDGAKISDELEPRFRKYFELF